MGEFAFPKKFAARRRRLPEKLSGLIRVAVEDAKLFGKTKGCSLVMQTWFTTNGSCTACLAGSMMVVSKGWRPGESVIGHDELNTNRDLTTRDRQKMVAIDLVRRGEVRTALQMLECALSKLSNEKKKILLKAEGIINERYSYVVDRSPWGDYLRAARLIEKAGF